MHPPASSRVAPRFMRGELVGGASAAPLPPASHTHTPLVSMARGRRSSGAASLTRPRGHYRGRAPGGRFNKNLVVEQSHKASWPVRHEPFALQTTRSRCDRSGIFHNLPSLLLSSQLYFTRIQAEARHQLSIGTSTVSMTSVGWLLGSCGSYPPATTILLPNAAIPPALCTAEQLSGGSHCWC